MPDTYFNGATWWVDHNKAWITRAINRGDDIYIASPLNNINMNVDNILVSQQFGPSYYANELKTLVDANYKPINLTNAEWQNVKTMINTIFN
jgi:hypothetical protein